MEEVAAFLANEPVLAVPVNVVGLVEEPLQAPEGPIPSVLNHPLGSNIQHILEDIDVESEDSVGMADDNLGPFTVAAVHTPRQPLSTIPEQGVSSRALTLKRPRSPILDEVERAFVSKRSQASGVPEAPEASESSESTAEVQPEWANWTFRGRLAKIGGDLNGNPFKAVVDLVDHKNL
jgi:hypothetical protein